VEYSSKKDRHRVSDWIPVNEGCLFILYHYTGYLHSFEVGLIQAGEMRNVLVTQNQVVLAVTTLGSCQEVRLEVGGVRIETFQSFEKLLRGNIYRVDWEIQ
jgi:hypothetical protein